MTGINRISQKVVCVAIIEVITPEGVLYTGPIPDFDAIYTVAAFAASGYVQGYDGEISRSDGISLCEVPSPAKLHSGAPMGWPIMAFEPVDERETDISALVALGNRVRETEPA